MIYLTLILCILNIALTVYFVYLKGRNSHSTQEEQKISRGLQLVQSKIAVLEDLSDQVDQQVKQVSSLLEGKYRELQNHLLEADSRVNEIQGHVKRGHEVSKLFKDKVPHEEMIQRKNQVKYVKAAKMAFAGASVEEIAQAVDLPFSEIDMIAKVNKNGLMFNDQALPDWVKEDLQETQASTDSDMSSAMFSRETPFIPPAKIEVKPEEKVALKNLGEQFKRATEAHHNQSYAGQTISGSMNMNQPQASNGAKPAPTIRPYEFRKINGNSL